MAPAQVWTMEMVPAQVWTMIVNKVLARELVHGDRPRGEMLIILRLLTINKKIVGLARDAAGRLGLVVIRCTVAQIPRAIRVFEYACELRVVGDVQVQAQVDRESAIASEALFNTGRRFRAFVSEETDNESKMAWLPLLPLLPLLPEGIALDEGCTVVCACSETKLFGTVVENLAKAYGAGWMTDLVIDYLGVREPRNEGAETLRSGFPNLSHFQGGRGLRLTLQQGDFPALFGADGAKFQSTSVTGLKLMWCDLVSVPPMRGFPRLTRLEMMECVFWNAENGDGDVLLSLSDAPVPPIEYLGLVACEGVHDVSQIAGLTKLKTLVMHECRGDYPDFDEAAIVVLKGKLVDEGAGRVLNVDGTGCLCKVVVRRLCIRKAEREAAGLVQCDSDCCGPCDCGECSDCE